EDRVREVRRECELQRVAADDAVHDGAHLGRAADAVADLAVDDRDAALGDRADEVEVDPVGERVEQRDVDALAHVVRHGGACASCAASTRSRRPAASRSRSSADAASASNADSHPCGLDARKPLSPSTTNCAADGTKSATTGIPSCANGYRRPGLVDAL